MNFFIVIYGNKYKSRGQNLERDLPQTLRQSLVEMHLIKIELIV